MMLKFWTKSVNKIGFIGLSLIWFLLCFKSVEWGTVGLILSTKNYWHFELNLFTIQALTILVNVLSIAFLIGLPVLVVKRSKEGRLKRFFEKLKIDKKQLGLYRLMKWSDIGLALMGLVLYFILTSMFFAFAEKYLPGIDLEQKQQLGFDLGILTPRLERLVAFLTIVVAVPILEELAFRGYLFGQLLKRLSFVTTALLVALVFAIMHGAWNVGIDVFALSLAMSVTRYLTKSIHSSILIHMLKNGLSFFILINSIGG